MPEQTNIEQDANEQLAQTDRHYSNELLGSIFIITAAIVYLCYLLTKVSGQTQVMIAAVLTGTLCLGLLKLLDVIPKRRMQRSIDINTVKTVQAASTAAEVAEKTEAVQRVIQHNTNGGMEERITNAIVKALAERGIGGGDDRLAAMERRISDIAATVGGRGAENIRNVERAP